MDMEAYPLTDSQLQALCIARNEDCVYAGFNPGCGASMRVSANSIAALARKGFVKIVPTSTNEVIGTTTTAGVAFLDMHGWLAR